MSIKNKISLVVINYNSTKNLHILLKSLKRIGQIIGEIIIVDNNSQDFKKKAKTKHIIIQNKQNLGFAKAVNQGIRKAKHSHILLLNPDARLTDKSIIKMFQKIQADPTIGAIGGKIYKTKNERQYTANSKPTFLTGLFEFTNLKKIFPNNYFSKKFWVEKSKNITKPVNIYGLCGAFIMFKKYLNQKINLFDENYFLYLEDLDFGLKIRKAGYKVIFFPQAKIRHIGGASSGSRYKIILKQWYKSRKYFFKKHSCHLEGSLLKVAFSFEEKLLLVYHYLKNEPAY